MNVLTKNQNGFTLIELLIALVVFAVGILGLATMQLTSIQGNGKGRYISEASHIAADRIEMFLTRGYGDALLDDDGGQFPAVADGAAGLNNTTIATADGSAVSADGNYQIFWNVVDNIPVASTKTIRVIVVPPDNGPNTVAQVVKARPM